MGKSGRCCPKEGVNRGAWSAIEDKLLTSYIEAHGEGKWTHLPKRAGLNRCGKSCRLRWMNYLRPNIKRGNISHDEEQLIIRLHNLLGNRWSLIAGRLPGRTDNEIKNYWNTYLARKLKTEQSHYNNNAKSGKDHSSKVRASDDTSIRRSQVIQPKATKCKNVVIIEPTYPNHPYQTNSNINSSVSNHMQLHVTEAEAESDHTNQSPKAQLVNEQLQFLEDIDDFMLNCCDDMNNEFQLNVADWSGDVVFDFDDPLVEKYAWNWTETCDSQVHHA